jgi:hypothetical protein
MPLVLSWNKRRWPRIFVLGPSGASSVSLARSLDLDNGDWLYVCHPSQLRGAHPGQPYLVTEDFCVSPWSVERSLLLWDLTVLRARCLNLG